jgi:hypothetical protein
MDPSDRLSLSPPFDREAFGSGKRRTTAGNGSADLLVGLPFSVI